MNCIKVLFLSIVVLIFNFNQHFTNGFVDRNCLKKQCFEQFGCFSIQPFIEEVKELLLSMAKLKNSVQTLLSLKQLLSICPISPDAMNVTFLLFTKESNNSQSFDYNLNTNDIKNSNFSPLRRTAVIVHGYTSGYEECTKGDCPWMAKIKNYFVSEDYNVVVVDWSTPAFDLNYFNSAFNTQIVGSIVAFFIKRLIGSVGANPKDFHLVGHSLGAHICGFAAKRLINTKLGHITGLDPAGPGFSINRLSKEDADLVTVIHTSAGVFKNIDKNVGETPIEAIQLFGLLGCDDTLGHFDFWPNGGNGQPGCKVFSKQFVNEVISDGLSVLSARTSCDHTRATLLPVSEMYLREPNSCQLIGYLCECYDDFNEGKCGDCGSDGQKCKPLEFLPKYYSKPDNWQNALQVFPNNFYIKTTDKTPFCVFHYQIIISVESSSTAGEINLKLIGDKPIEMTFNNPISGFKSGYNYTKLYTDSENIGQITEAIIEFDSNIFGKLTKFGKKINPLRSREENSIKVNKISINFMSNIDESIRQKYSSELLPNNENTNTNENYLVFKLK